MPEHLGDLLAGGLAVEELDGAATAEAVAAQSRSIDAHRSQGVCRQGQEDGKGDTSAQVRLGVQAGVLPLPVDGQAVDRQAGLVQRAGQGPDIGRPCSELARPSPDLSRRKRGPKAGDQRDEG